MCEKATLAGVPRLLDSRHVRSHVRVWAQGDETGGDDDSLVPSFYLYKAYKRLRHINRKMGGHGGLNILPQKSWNVYGHKQRQRVKRDEERAAEEENAALEARLQELRRGTVPFHVYNDSSFFFFSFFFFFLLSRVMHHISPRGTTLVHHVSHPPLSTRC